MDSEKIIEKFRKLPQEVSFNVDTDWVADKVAELKEEYNINLIFVVLAIFTGDIKRDQLLDLLINEFELNELDGERVYNELNREILEPLIKKIEFFNLKNDNILIRELINIAEDIFSRELINVLNEDKYICGIVNLRIFKILNSEINYSDNLSRVLYLNQESVAHLTIADWLKDFISQKGSSMFNDIVLTDYITNSPNCQKLTADERRLVWKLLMLYRNLKFFPESMPNDTGEGWEIIPIDDEVRDFDRGGLGVPKTEEEKNIEVMQAEGQAYSADSLEKKMIEEEINAEKRIEGLKIMAKRYPEGSLEWRAIMDEVRKLTL
jgi:hypothetical protein